MEPVSEGRLVEHLADVGTMRRHGVARIVDVGHDQVHPLRRARRGGREVGAELDRAPRAGRRELDETELITVDIGVDAYNPDPIEPPTEGSVYICCSQPRNDMALDL